MLSVSERAIRYAFRASLFAKGAFALMEIVGGVLAFFVSQAFLYKLVAIVTQNELTEDPSDFVANYLLMLAQNFSVSAQHFTAYYLASHGVVKLFLIAGLLKERLWAYPAALIVFSLLIVYQTYRFSVTSSPWLLVISVLDAFIIVLTLHEWRYLKHLRAPSVEIVPQN